MDTCLKGDKNKPVSGGGANTWLGGDVNNLKKAPYVTSQRADLEKSDLLGVLRVLLTDACALCWRGRCSSRFPPGQAEPPCPASWGSWAASSWPADIAAETCCTEVTVSVPPISSHYSSARFGRYFFLLFFFYTQMNLNTHRRPDCWLFLFVCAPCDSRGCQPLMQDKKHKKTKKTKILQPTVCCQSFGSWLNEFRVNMSKISKADVQFPFPGKVIHLSTDNNFRPLARRKRLLQSSAKSLAFQSQKLCFSSACFTSSRSVFSSERSFKREKRALHFSFLSTRARKLYIWQCCWWFDPTIWLNPEHSRLHSNWLQKKDW